MELFDIDADALSSYLRDAGLREATERMVRLRPLVDRAALLRALDLGTRSMLAQLASEERYNAGDHIVEQGQISDDFFLLADGAVDIEAVGRPALTVRAEDDDNFFGELSAVYPSRPRDSTVRAKTVVRILRLRGQKVRELFESDTSIRFALSGAIGRRSG